MIGTDAETWLQLREGELSGVEAFSQRRLYARGDLDLAVGFEGLFRLPSGRPPLLRIHHVPVGKLRISHADHGRRPGHAAPARPRLVEGELLRHRRRAQPPLPRPRDRPARASAAPPSPRSPPTAPRSPRKAVIGTMDALDIEQRPPGRQQHGRAGGDRGRARAARTASAGSRCSARPWRSCTRDWHWAVRFARPELGMLPHSLGRGRIERTFWALFADRDLVDPSMADIVVDEFERIYRSRGARLAFISSAPARSTSSRRPPSIRGSRRCSRPRCSCGPATTG